MPALIFDCDGVLADTERDGHLRAFNATFAHFELPLRWSEEEYAEKLLIGGGKERMATLFSDPRLADLDLPGDPDERQRLLARWHHHKTEVYKGIVAAGELPGRPGIVRLTDEAIAAGWQLAVASTSALVSVRAVLEHVVGPERAARFLVAAGDVVSRKKPDPEIYDLVLERLKLDPREGIAIEDSRNGLLAARGAGLACVVTVSHYSGGEGFREAAIVVSDLGEPRQPMRVLANRTPVEPAATVTVADLEGVLGEVLL